MDPVTTDDRRNELRTLLEQIEAHPERDWTSAKERINVLKEMLHPREPAA